MAQAVTQQRIEIPYPDATDLSLLLRTGPCRLHFAPSDGPAWISGTYEDQTGALPIEVRPGAPTSITQRFDPSSFGDIVLPRLDLAIARTRAFALEIQAGASETAVDLGGLPLSRLVMKTGAGKFDIAFSTPNPTTMALIDLGAGAGAFNAKRLANANFVALRYGGGVSSCSLDFSGELLRDATVRIDAGLGSVDLIVPATTAARVRTKAFASTRRATGGFTAQGDVYSTTPALQGARPLLDIDVSLAFGALNLTTT